MGDQRLCEVRQRDAVLQYWDLIQQKKDKEAYENLTTMVGCWAHHIPWHGISGLASQPWRLLTEVAHVHEHYQHQEELGGRFVRSCLARSSANGSVPKPCKGRSGRSVSWRSCKGQACGSRAVLCVLVGQFHEVSVMSS